MDFRFTVGDVEKHELVYSWDQIWGRIRLTVDGIQVVKKLQLAGGLTSNEEMVIGVTERHHVRIEKRRELFFAGFRPQYLSAYVDGVKVAEAVAHLSPSQSRNLILLTIGGAVVGALVGWFGFAAIRFIG